MAAQHLAPPDVIKIDIEGAEALMLEGARETLQSAQPDLLIELHGVPAAQNVFRILDSLGYTCFGEIGAEGNKTYRRVSESDMAGLKDYYDLHFLIATFHPERLEQPIELFPMALAA